MTDRGWNLDASRTGFFQRFADEPPVLYQKNPAFLIQHHGLELATRILEHVPERSNDYLLDATVYDLVELLPADLASDASKIFVGRAEDMEPNAAAWRPAENARVACVHVGMALGLVAYAGVLRAVEGLLRRHGVGSANGLEALKAAMAHVDELKNDPIVQVVSAARTNWRAADAVLPSAELLAALDGLDDRLPSGELVVNRLMDHGEHFVVAHELGHHILGHTDPPHPDREPYAGLLKLHEVLHGRAPVGEWSYSQDHEFQADAFAFATMAGLLSGHVTPYKWFSASIGALVALPLLADVKSDGDLAAGNLAIVGDEHPPTSSRIEWIEALAVDYPAEAIPPAGSPVGYLAQLTLFREVLAVL